MDFIINWSKQIVVFLVIIIIFEMILPNSQNRKYIRIVLGIFTMYVIISPILGTNSENILDEFVEELVTSDYQTNVSYNNIDIVNGITEDVYKENLISDIKTSLNEQGYIVDILNIETEDDNSISKLRIMVTGKVLTENTDNDVNTIKIESISIDTNTNNISTEENIDQEDLQTVTNYIISTYGITESNLEVVKP